MTADIVDNLHEHDEVVWLESDYVIWVINQSPPWYIFKLAYIHQIIEGNLRTSDIAQLLNSCKKKI